MRRTPTTAAVLLTVGLALSGCAVSAPGDTDAGSSPSASEPPASASPSPSPTEQPTPSATPDASASAPTPITDITRLNPMLDRELPVAEWTTPSSLLAVFIGGSGTAACVPKPLQATVTSSTTVEVAFDSTLDPDTMCTADYTAYGWDFPVTGLDASQPVDVTLIGIGSDPTPVVIPLAPMP